MRSNSGEIGRLDISRSRLRSRDVWATLVLGVFFAVVVVGQFVARPHRSYLEATGDDFAAFYCGGTLVLTKADPYRVEPLRSCESSLVGGGGRADTVVDPAPLPGYALGFFALVALVPFGVAKAYWFIAMMASLVGSALLVGRLTSLPSSLIFLGLCVADFESFQFGQLPPLVIAATCAAAFLMRSRRYAGAAVCAATTMIEPHLGLPVCLAMFLCRAQTRLTFAACALALAAVSVLTTGVHGNVEYFAHVLPDQVSAELVAVDQYSLSHMLHLAGLHDRIAVMAGSVSYLIMVALGVWLGRSLSAVTADDAYVALVPPAAAMLGGTYIHSLQFAAALPAAYLLASMPSTRRIGWCAVILLVVPWEYLVAGKLYALSYFVALVTFCVLAWSGFVAARNEALPKRLGTAAFFSITFLFAIAVLGHLPNGQRHIAGLVSDDAGVVAAIPSNADASKNWGAYLRSNPQLSVASVRREADKLPTWLAIGLLLIAAYRCGGLRRDSSERNAALRTMPNPL